MQNKDFCIDGQAFVLCNKHQNFITIIFKTFQQNAHFGAVCAFLDETVLKYFK